MKQFCLLIFALIPFHSLVSQAQGAARTPSLQETITWMENYSQGHGLYISTAHGTIYNRIEKLGGCEVRLSIDYSNTSPAAAKHVSTKISLAIFDPKSVKQINDADDHEVTVERSDGAMKTYSDVEMWDGRKTVGYSNTETLFFDSEEASQRFAKALSYAIASAPF
jgi:hypothetical protein